ncbi:unnamed protein product [Brassica oleracea var. botrytis]
MYIRRIYTRIQIVARRNSCKAARGTMVSSIIIIIRVG